MVRLSIEAQDFGSTQPAQAKSSAARQSGQFETALEERPPGYFVDGRLLSDLLAPSIYPTI